MRQLVPVALGHHHDPLGPRPQDAHHHPVVAVGPRMRPEDRVRVVVAGVEHAPQVTGIDRRRGGGRDGGGTDGRGGSLGVHLVSGRHC